MSGTRLTLVIPGLFATLRELSPLPRLPALERMVVRGTREPLPELSFPHHLASLFGLTTEQDLPLGALCRIGERAAVDDGWWFCAAPVHYYASRDRLRLASVEEVRQEEAQALVALFNTHFGADGWELEAVSAAHWYLRAPGPQALRTRPLHEVEERDLRHSLPEGPDALRCHRFLNEVQMLFHGSTINGAREERGQPPINGLWFWGGGHAPALPRQFDQVWSDLPLARGLAQVSGAEPQPLPGRLPPLAGNALAVVKPGTNAGAWQCAEQGWFAAIERGLRDGAIAELAIEGDDCRVRVTAADLRRWWRLRRPLNRCE